MREEKRGFRKIMAKEEGRVRPNVLMIHSKVGQLVLVKEPQEKLNPPSDPNTLLPKACKEQAPQARLQHIVVCVLGVTVRELWFAGWGREGGLLTLPDFPSVLASRWLCRRNVPRREESVILGSFRLLHFFLNQSVLFLFPH